MVWRSFFLAVTVLCVGAWPSFAEQRAGAGCGPANYVFEGNKTKTGHVLAALLNLTSFPTQLGAISSGTSGCRSDSSVQRQRELDALVADADVALEQGIAQGEGPYLEALAGAMGCPAGAFPEFAQWAQSEYALSLNGQGSLGAFVRKLDADIEVHPGLAHQCRIAG